MLDRIDRMMAIVAKVVMTAVIEGFAAYAGSVHVPAGYDDTSPSSQDFSSPRRWK
jgi:hypothetical protein